MAGNSNLHMSKAGKTDEFYTQLSLVENELKHYRDHFRDKIIFLNCDDPTYSAFWEYFQMNFYFLGLKKLISTHYEADKKSYKLEISRSEEPDGQFSVFPDYTKIPLDGDGDFRSDECIEILKEADLVITNPPFSLFKHYIAQLVEYDKKFLIIGNQNAVTYSEVFPLIRDNKLWLGYNNGHYWFKVPDDYEIKKTDFKVDKNGQKWRRMGNICWYTNLEIEKRFEPMTLYANYDPKEYPKYDTIDAIEVSRTLKIPVDYDGIMGVPITFMQYYCPDQFEIVGKIDTGATDEYNLARPIVNGKAIYKRIAIRRKR